MDPKQIQHFQEIWMISSYQLLFTSDLGRGDEEFIHTLQLT